MNESTANSTAFRWDVALITLRQRLPDLAEQPDILQLLAQQVRAAIRQCAPATVVSDLFHVACDVAWSQQRILTTGHSGSVRSCRGPGSGPSTARCYFGAGWLLPACLAAAKSLPAGQSAGADRDTCCCILHSLGASARNCTTP